MPTIDDKVYSLDTRVSETEKDITAVSLHQKHLSRRMDKLDITVVNHMEKEEKDRVIMTEKLDGLMRYKWILFGAMVMLWLTSGDNHILNLLKVVG